MWKEELGESALSHIAQIKIFRFVTKTAVKSELKLWLQKVSSETCNVRDFLYTMFLSTLTLVAVNWPTSVHFLLQYVMLSIGTSAI